MQLKKCCTQKKFERHLQLNLELRLSWEQVARTHVFLCSFFYTSLYTSKPWHFRRYFGLFCVEFDIYYTTCVRMCRTLFTFWTAIFVKYDILTEYLTLFWFDMLVNEYKLYVSIQKSSKDTTFWKCLCLVVPLCYEHAELMRRMDIIFKVTVYCRVSQKMQNHWNNTHAARIRTPWSAPNWTQTDAMYDHYCTPLIQCMIIIVQLLYTILVPRSSPSYARCDEGLWL
jgi:hypothetical protein